MWPSEYILKFYVLKENKMKLTQVMMKALLIVGMTLAMINCSGAHEDDASLEASQQQAEDGQVIVYDEQGEQQEQQQEEVTQQDSQQQEEVAQQDSQQQEEIVEDDNTDYANEEVVSDNNNEQEENLNNMLNRISDDQEPVADDQPEYDNAETADSTDDQNSYDDQAQNDDQEINAVSNNDSEQMNKSVDQEYVSTSGDNQNYQTSGKIHVVKQGESLSKISKMYYGKYRFWRGLASVNSITNPNVIYPGQRIQMVEAGETAAMDSGSSNYESGNYVVRTGDTLGTISKNVYGSSRYWKALYYKNKSELSNPDMIYKGQSLSVVPKADIASYQKQALEAVAH